MSSIFLSHNHADKPFVRRLAQDLQAAGIRVWIDEAELMIGDSLIEKIRQGIDDMDYLGVILSPNSVHSSWVKRELDIAMNQEIDGKRIKVLPLVIKDCDLPGFLEGKLYADFRNPKHYAMELSKVLRRVRDGKKAEPQPETLTDENIPSRSNKRFILGATIIGLLLLIPMFYFAILLKIIDRTSVASQTNQEFDAEEKIKHLIVMVTGEFDGMQTFGAGIIFGRGSRPARLYVVTPNHVVRRGTNSATALQIRLRSLPGERIEAKLLDTFHSKLDIAVLVIDLVQHAISIDTVPFNRLSAANIIKRGDKVYHVGHPNGAPWYVNTTPDLITQTNEDYFLIESMTVSIGDAGAGLFNDRWELVGMIQADQPPLTKALRIERILEALKEWGYPVSLNRSGVK